MGGEGLGLALDTSGAVVSRASPGDVWAREVGWSGLDGDVHYTWLWR